MSEQQEKGTNWVAVITMMFIYGMISFVTNLAAPMGNVWKYQPGIDGSNMLGMMGNMMNFLAYVFMGIPAGRMLTNCGYKKTAMIGIATGFVGVLIQFLSGGRRSERSLPRLQVLVEAGGDVILPVNSSCLFGKGRGQKADYGKPLIKRCGSELAFRYGRPPAGKQLLHGSLFIAFVAGTAGSGSPYNSAAET